MFLKHPLKPLKFVWTELLVFDNIVFILILYFNLLFLLQRVKLISCVIATPTQWDVICSAVHGSLKIVAAQNEWKRLFFGDLVTDCKTDKWSEDEVF
jgi:hypothetical protein